jgi:peptidoglycan/xylan/chitin deacetylase (PgdA/CDA1 family)
MTTQSIAAGFAAVLLLSLSACGHPDKPSAASLQISKCVEELNGIPALAGLRRSRNKPDQENQRPFEGMELALTINEMVTSRVDDQNVDDLCYAQDTRENFDKLMKALGENNMPPTVNFIEGLWLDPPLQTEWLKSGNLLGNLTYDRRKAKKSHEQEFVDNIARNDQLLASLWKAFPPRKKFFRYPHVKAADDRDRELTSAYLKQNGYVEVPVTIESPEEVFGQMYCGALAKGNIECANLIKANFFSLLLDAASKARSEARERAGHEIKHILSVRASQLTCDTLAEMLVWFKGLGARFISLDEALGDPYYDTKQRSMRQ